MVGFYRPAIPTGYFLMNCNIPYQAEFDISSLAHPLFCSKGALVELAISLICNLILSFHGLEK